MAFEFKDIFDKRFLIFFLSAVVLHGIWDTSLTVLGSDMLKIFILIVIVWILVFILMGRFKTSEFTAERI